MSEYKPNIIERISTRLMGRRPPIVESTTAPRVIQARRGKGIYEYSTSGIFTKKGKGTIKLSPVSTKNWFRWYENDSTVRSGINALTETAAGLGYHTSMPSSFILTFDKDGELIPSEQKKLVDEFGRVHNLDHLMPNIVRLMLLAGFCPVETQITKFPTKSIIKIIHPATVKELHVDENGKFDYLIQDDGTQAGRTLTSKEVALFTYNQMGNDYTGLSLVSTVESLLSIKHSALNNMEGMIERYISPIYIWKSTGDITPVQNLLEHRSSGEDIFLGNLDLNEFDQFGATPIEVQGDAKFKDFIDFVDQLIWIGINSPNQMYWRNATEASATVLEDMIDKNINAIQRNTARGMEDGFFKPLLIANKYDPDKDNDCPRVAWGVETTGTEDIMPSDIINKGLDLFYIRETEYWEILHQMGIKVTPKRSTKMATDDKGGAEEPTVEPDEENPDKDDSDSTTDTE